MNKHHVYMASGVGVAVLIALVVGGGAMRLVARAGDTDRTGPAAEASASMSPEEKFRFLSAQQTNSCGGGKAAVTSLPEEGRMQGACCGPMDLHSYIEQTEGLKEKFGDYDIIPPDPYDVPVAWAQEMIAFGERAVLTPEQQAVYDEATGMSHEGPCCCVCWHWYAYDGLAKFLIVNEGFGAQQIADVWDLSDACGGDHHHH